MNDELIKTMRLYSELSMSAREEAKRVMNQELLHFFSLFDDLLERYPAESIILALRMASDLDQA